MGGGSGDWGNVHWGPRFLLLATGDIPDSWMFVVCCWCLGGRRSVFPLFVSFVLCGSSEISLFSLSFASSFGFVLSFRLLSPLALVVWRGITAGGGLCRAGFDSRCRGESALFSCSFFCYS